MTTTTLTPTPDLLEQARRILAGSDTAQEPSGCCSTAKQQTCCEASAKDACCGSPAASAGGCGCQ